MSTEVATVSTASAPALVETAKTRVEKMKNFAAGYRKDAENMTPEIDQKFQEFIVKISAAKKDMNEKRSPYTREFDRIKKLFTEQENAVEALIAEFSGYRNNYLKKVREEAEKKRLEQLKAELAAQELITIKANIELGLSAHVVEMVRRLKKGILASLKTVTPENQKQKYDGLKKLSTVLDVKKLDEYTCEYVSKYGHDVAVITKQMVPVLQDSLAKMYAGQIEEYKAEAVLFFQNVVAGTKLPQALEDEIDIEANQIIEGTAAIVQAEAEGAKADIVFAGMTANQDEITIPESRDGVKIHIENEAGYVSLIAYWCATLCHGLDVSQFESKTVGSMVKDCEKHALKTGTKIQSPYIRYEDTYKAVNRAK